VGLAIVIQVSRVSPVNFRMLQSSVFPSAFQHATLRLVAMAAAAVVALAGCAQQAQRAQAPQPEPTAAQAAVAEPAPAPPPAREPESELPNQDLSDTVLYEFLLAEIAAQRGNVGLAAQAYADLARRTRDPRIARRATEIAVFARLGNAAIDSARVWHETQPRSQRALQTLSGLLISAGRFDEALPYVRKLLAAVGGGAGEGFMQLNRTLASVKDKSAALALIQRLVDDYPQLAQAHYALAQAAANADQRDLALTAIRRAQELKPDWEAAVLLEAQSLQSGAESGAAGIERLSRYLQRYPNSREVRLAYARALVADRRFAEARGEFQKLVADFPANADVIYAVALLSLQLSDYGPAESNLKRLLELDFADKATVRLYLGQIAEEQKNYAEALRRYGEVDEGEQYLPAQIRYAQVLAKQGRLAEARAHLQQQSASGNQQRRVQLVLAEAQILRDANQTREAYELVERALEGQPEDPDLLYDYAMLAEKIERFDVLEASLKKLIALRPDHAHAYNALGYTFADRNLRLAEARELIEKAMKLAPDDFFIVDSMGWVLYRLGKLEESVKYLQRAFSGRADPEIAAHLGEVLWISGKRTEAEKILGDAVQKYPNNEALNNTIQRLKR
jgi:tetratricopeptide (TPR) repeat protein